MSVPATSPSSSIDSHGDTITHIAATIEPPTGDLLARHARPLPTVPGFRIIGWLGGGGMGDVYEAVDEKLNITFALKMVRPDRLSPGFAARFRQEARSMVGLDHPNVARIFAHGEVDGRPYITMRFVRGGTLADRMPTLRANPKDAVRLLVKVIDAVEYLHRQGQVHRDLKPANILVDEAGEPYLSDFGLVKDLADHGGSDDIGQTSPLAAASTAPDDETQSAMPGAPHQGTRTGARLGTYDYMSPEQARGDIRRIGPASDVWALGVILYEMLTGKRPDRDSVPAAPGVDAELDRIVLKCLSREPTERYPSAAVLAQELRAWMAPAIPIRRKHWAKFAVAAGLLLVGVGITFAILRGSRDKTPDEWRAWARKELQAGRPVTVVDAEGNLWAGGLRFVVGEGPAKSEHDPAGWLALHTSEAALAEILDDPGVDEFTLAGEMRPLQPSNLPRAGFYVAGRRVASPTGDWHFQVEYLYDENPANFPRAPAPAGGQPRPNGRSFKPTGVKLIGDPDGNRELRLHGLPTNGRGSLPERLFSRAIGPDRREQDGPWRTLAIHARGDVFTVTWDGTEEYRSTDIPAAKLATLQNALREWPDPPLQFKARGAAGICIEGGSVAVRNVTITPSR